LGRWERWESPVVGEKEKARTPHHWISSEEDRFIGAGGEEDARGRVAGEPRRYISNGEEGPRELRPRAPAELALPGEEEAVASTATGGEEGAGTDGGWSDSRVGDAERGFFATDCWLGARMVRFMWD
jgi:hypothetical protein